MIVENQFDRLAGAILFYGEAANYLEKENVLNEDQCNALHIMLDISAHLHFHKNDATYTFENEVILLINVLEKLEEHKASLSTETKDPFFIPTFIDTLKQSIMRNVALHLIMMHDLFIQRNPEKERFAEISNAIGSLPTNLFEKTQAPESSATTAYLCSTSKLSFQAQDLDLTQYKEMIRQSVDWATDNLYLRPAQYDRILLNSMLNTNNNIASDKHLALCFILLLDICFLAPEEKKMTNLQLKKEDFINLIKQLFNEWPDKEKFVTIFLTTFDSWVSELPCKYSALHGGCIVPSNAALFALKNINILFPLFDRELSPNRLFALITAHLSNWISEIERLFGEMINICAPFSSVDAQNSCSTLSQTQIKNVADLYSKNENLYPHLQVAGRSANTFLKLLSSTLLSEYLSPTFQTELFNLFEKNEKLKNEFESFVELFCQINSQADVYQQRNPRLFFLKYQTVLLQMIKIMGVEGVRYFRAQLAGTVLSLERILSRMQVISTDEQDHLMWFFQKHNISFRENPKEIDAIVNSLILFGFLRKENFLTWQYLNLSTDKSPQEYYLLLIKILLEKIFSSTGLTLTSEEITRVLQSIPIEKIASLMVATNKMLTSDYEKAYLCMLKKDLFFDGVNDGTYKTEDDDETEKEIALHNQRIREILEKHNINPENALRYSKEISFYVAPDSSDEKATKALSLSYDTLARYILQLEKEIKKLEPTPQLSKLINLIEKFKKESNDASEFYKKTVKDTLGEVNQSLIELAKQPQDFSNTFNEFSEHIREQYKLIKKQKNNKKIEKKEYSFNVQQWKKENNDTFFLGDAVGCCLATTGSQFPAMVQRRLDDAMLMHVAIDNETKLPAALIWLYLAETNDKKIVLVANFFEVNAKYATNEKLRLGLLNGLLHFTNQYCQDNPNIAAFYMNQLHYGWNRQDLNNYSIEAVSLSDKVGGPYVPGLSSEEYETLDQNVETKKQIRKYTTDMYYLNSLFEEKFLRFDSKNLVPFDKTSSTSNYCSNTNPAFFSKIFNQNLKKSLNMKGPT